MSLLKAVSKAAEVVAERTSQYPSTLENHERIADLWSGYLQQHVNAIDVACMMVLFKLGRMRSALEVGGSIEDSLVDATGYLLCAAEIADDLRVGQGVQTPRVRTSVDGGDRKPQAV